MSSFFGAIADDFTGATDLAALLARSGHPVSLRIGIPPSGPIDSAPFEIIALKCRTAPVTAAVAQAREALSWLRRAGAERFFWKYCSTFDSTPHGNIGPVAEALMADLDIDQTIYCPAFPENGRRIFMGNLFVGTDPLAESPMKDHPLTPMRDSNLVRLLRPQVTRPVGLADRTVVSRGAAALRARLADLAAEDVAHVIVDAIEDADLRVIAEACRDMLLMTGGSAVAMPLPTLWREEGMVAGGRDAAAAPAIGEGAVVLAGSCSAMTNRQVEAFRARGHPALRVDPAALVRDGPARAVDWLRSQDLGNAPIIYATADPATVREAQQRLGADIAGEAVEDALAACAVAAREMGAGRIIVAGGESSGAVVNGLGIDRLIVGREIAPGVPWCFAASGSQSIALTLKSGNFGAETFFSDAVRGRIA